ncbi:MAG: E3 ubiquitin ligase family protein [Nanoarchaeota archaeon]|nr:E3 ubiquitin ligase family protein [Nanoarchaeota archaeon]
MAGAKEYVIGGVITAIGAGLFAYGFNRMSRYRLIADTPTSKIRSMAMGLVEIHGNVKATETIKTPFSQSACVYYKYEIKEYRKHTSTDSKGRSRTTYSWDTVGRGERRICFNAKDDTGEVPVKPEGAEFNVPVKKVFLQKAGLFGAFNTILGALKNWDNQKTTAIDVAKWKLTPLDPKQRVSFGSRVGDRKYYEYYIEPDENLFILGTAANEGANKVVLKKGENEKTYMISNRSEKELVKGLKLQMIAFFAIGGIVFLGGILLILYFAGVI